VQRSEVGWQRDKGIVKKDGRCAVGGEVAQNRAGVVAIEHMRGDRTGWKTEACGKRRRAGSVARDQQRGGRHGKMRKLTEQERFRQMKSRTRHNSQFAVKERLANGSFALQIGSRKRRH
jgi:hypothetical protein